jgi:hypothetical protein
MSARKTIEGKVTDSKYDNYSSVPLLDKFMDVGVGLNKMLEKMPEDGSLIAGESTDRTKNGDIWEGSFSKVAVNADNFIADRFYYLNEANEYVIAGNYISGIQYYGYNIEYIGRLADSEYIPNQFFVYDTNNEMYVIVDSDYNNEEYTGT